ncbi:MAG: glycoside hydrolase family 10 protein [Microcoleaceae cyanobacterium]
MFKWYRQRHQLLCILLFIITLIGTSLNPIIVGQAASATEEIRGVWLTNVDSEVLFSSLRTTAVLSRLKQLHFNTIYPTIWQGGYTLYPSAVADKTFGVTIDPTPGLQNRDMLQELIVQGHQQQLTVIPWFEFGFMAPADSELVKNHPTWLTQRQDGSTIHTQGVDDRVWLNPFLPEVQQFILELVLEVVQNYELDGIQFDDHFGLPSDFGYDDYTLNLYRQETGKTQPPRQFKDQEWVQWRADKISEFMEQVFKAVKAVKPDCIVSLSPNPYGFALSAYLQDWLKWQQQGWIEELLIQVYRSDMERFIAELERTELQQAKQQIPVAIGILSGLKNRSMSIKMIEDQIEAVRKRDFAGVSFFFYESLWRWAQEPILSRENKIQELFADPADRPSMTAF